MNDGRQSPRRSSRPLEDLGRYSGYGITWVVTILLLGWGGLVLDERFGTSPLLVLAGAMVGMVAGFYTLYVRLVVEPAEKKKEEPGLGEEH